MSVLSVFSVAKILMRASLAAALLLFATAAPAAIQERPDAKSAPNLPRPSSTRRVSRIASTPKCG